MLIKRYRKLLTLGLITAFLCLGNYYYGWTGYLREPANLDILNTLLLENFWLAALLYMGITIVSCVVLALPGVIFAVLAGVVFGPWLGAALCLAATTAGAALAFLVGRFFLKDAVKPMVSKNKYLKRILFDEADKSDLILLLITRILPVFPYNLQNFAYGITDITFWRYTLYTFIFMLPGVVFFTTGAAGFSDPENRRFYLTCAALLAAAIFILAFHLKNKIIKREE